MKSFWRVEFDRGTTKLHARILRGKGVQKQKPNMFTIGSSTSATFDLPVYIYYTYMFSEFSVYIYILYCHYECLWYECDAVDPLQDELMSARPGSSGFPAFQIGCKDSPRCSMCPFCLRFLSWRRAELVALENTKNDVARTCQRGVKVPSVKQGCPRLCCL